MRDVRNSGQQQAELVIQRGSGLLQACGLLSQRPHFRLQGLGVFARLFPLADLLTVSVPLRLERLCFRQRCAALLIDGPERLQVQSEAAIGKPRGDCIEIGSKIG